MLQDGITLLAQVGINDDVELHGDVEDLSHFRLAQWTRARTRVACVIVEQAPGVVPFEVDAQAVVKVIRVVDVQAIDLKVVTDDAMWWVSRTGH